MSELKATTAQEIVRNEKDCDYMDELFGGVKMPPTQVYLKSEADKVIDEKDAKILALEAEVFKQKHHAELFFDERNYAEEQLRHQKYKRCLSMAMWCRARYNEWSAYYPTTTTRKMKFLDKWEKRWFELAEKFKPNSTAQ